MKQRDLILGLGILSAFSMAAASSPYTGSALPAEGSADFYLYQVETGQWIQNNYLPGFWTTRAALGENGFDVSVIAVEGGYQLDAKLRGNGSINGHNLYMDTGDAKTVWEITPVAVDGVTNAYKIVAVSGPNPDTGNGEPPYPHTLGADGDGVITYTAENNTTWQFVTREERIAKMKADLANGPVDASWLVPAQDFSRNDMRQDLWKIQYTEGQVCGNDGSMYNAVRETWNNFHNYAHYITVTDLPNGTYKLTMQGFYHENRDLDETWQKFFDGVDPKNGKYFAGASTGEFMNVAEQHIDDEMREGLAGRWPQPGMLDGEYIPDGCEAVSQAVDRGYYQNPELTAVVKDGRLILGVIKLDGSENDWMCYDNVKLTYVSDETPAVDVAPLVEDLNAMIADMENLPATPASAALIEAGREALLSLDATDLRASYLRLLEICNSIKQSEGTLSYFNLIRPLAVAEGADVRRADSDLAKAVSRDDFNEALKQLRWARRRAHAERNNLEYKGSTPQAGDFYLYNVGQKQFLCGGSDWGTHAALGFPGVELTLENPGEEDDGTYYIDTHYTTGTNHYLNYRGYMDCNPSTDFWKFIPVEGKENVYRIEQANWPGVIIAYNIDANTDGDANRDETTVGCENRNFAGPAEDAEWMLISREEREKMLENATLENPVDASFFLPNPNFHRVLSVDDWMFQNGTATNRGDRVPDGVIESWNTADCDLGVMVSGLPEGTYRFSANAFYRNGDHESIYYSENHQEHPGEIEFYGQPDTEVISNAYLYAGDFENDVEVPNILDGSGIAPGEGASVKSAEGTIYTYPQFTNQCHAYFRLGAYRVHTFLDVEDGEDVAMGVYKDNQDYEHDWLVADNFRLLYFGPNTTKEEAKSGIEEVTVAPVEVEGDNRIFNLQGIQVTNTNAPGIYIRNGKKFVVK